MNIRLPPHGLRGVGGALTVNIIQKGWEVSSVLYKQCQQVEIIIINLSQYLSLVHFIGMPVLRRWGHMLIYVNVMNRTSQKKLTYHTVLTYINTHNMYSFSLGKLSICTSSCTDSYKCMT